jgi:hypothetical protein
MGCLTLMKTLAQVQIVPDQIGTMLARFIAIYSPWPKSGQSHINKQDEPNSHRERLH